MTATIGFDRGIELAWLDLVASRYAETRDPSEAFRATRGVVEMTVAGGSSPHNAAGKTMTVLARIWLRVPPEAVRLRDDACEALVGLEPGDRLAVHWAMASLAYPFFLDSAASVGRMLRLQDEFTVAQFKQRLAERWGARGTTPQAAQRLLHTWASWGTLEMLSARGHFGRVPRTVVGRSTAVLVARGRVLAEQGKALSLAEIGALPDLFPFDRIDPLPVLRDAPDVVVHTSGSGLMISAPGAASAT